MHDLESELRSCLSARAQAVVADPAAPRPVVDAILRRRARRRAAVYSAGLAPVGVVGAIGLATRPTADRVSLVDAPASAPTTAANHPPPSAPTSTTAPDPGSRPVAAEPTGLVVLDDALIVTDLAGAELRRIELPAPSGGFAQILHTARSATYVIDGPRLHILDDALTGSLRTVEAPGGGFGPVTQTGYYLRERGPNDNDQHWSFVSQTGETRPVTTLTTTDHPIGEHDGALIVWDRLGDRLYLVDGDERTPITAAFPLAVGHRAVYTLEGTSVARYDLTNMNRSVIADIGDEVPASTLTAAAESLDGSRFALLTKNPNTYATSTLVVVDLAAGTAESIPQDAGATLAWIDAQRLLISGDTEPRILDLQSRAFETLGLPDRQIGVLAE